MNEQVKKYLPFILLGVGVLVLVFVFVFIKNRNSNVVVDDTETLAEVAFKDLLHLLRLKMDITLI